MILQVNATDADSLDNGVVIYYLLSHPDVFKLHPDSGQTSIKMSLANPPIAKAGFVIKAIKLGVCLTLEFRYHSG